MHLNDIKLKKKNKLIIYVHGILGNKRNWRSPMKYMSTLRPDAALMAIDLRGHGESATAQHGPPTDRPKDQLDREANTVATCAEDIHNLLTSFHSDGLIREDTSVTLVAHSFGGKVALKYLELCEKLRAADSSHAFVPVDTWIVDSIPGAHRSNIAHFLEEQAGATVQTQRHAAAEMGATNIQVEKVLKCLYKLPRTFQSREWCIDALQSETHSCRLPPSLAQWLGTSIVDVRTPNKHSHFVFRVDQLIDFYNDYCGVDMHKFLQSYAAGSSPSGAARAGAGGGSISDLIGSIAAQARQPARSRVHFLRAGKNTSWDSPAPQGAGLSAAAYLQSLISAQGAVPQLLHYHVMPHVNHWVHAEDMRGFTELVHRNSL
jgi:pimeloyl-ACP methyl ester carboxylesterase